MGESIWSSDEPAEIVAIIPAFNEAASIAKVISDVPKNLVAEVVVVNNNSIDATSIIAKNAGATVLDESRQGYGFACLSGINYLKQQKKKPDIVVFLDGDYSDYPEEMVHLVKPIIEQNYDFVIGSRTLGNKERRAMSLQQVFGNWLATKFIRLFYGTNFTDLGPFRAIRFDKLIGLDMKDQTYGWTVEMQIKAVKQNLRISEVPVNYRVRIGSSKISGTVKGSIAAGYKIITTIFKYL